MGAAWMPWLVLRSGAALFQGAYFKNAETNTRGANEWHGDRGPITVKPSRIDLPICDAFLAAAQGAGFAIVDDLNADIAEDFGRIDANIANGRRASTAVAYV